MPTRAEILDTLAASQTQVMAFFHGLSAEDLERPATASDVPGAAPWRAKDHLAHLVNSERAIQHLLRRTLAGETRDVLLRLQYPEGMPMPGILGDLSAPTREEGARLEVAVASINQAYVNAHHDDSMELLAADFLAARQETVDLLHQFTDDQLAAPVPTVVGEATAGDLFAGRAGHATEHISSVEEGWQRLLRSPHTGHVREE
jgi:DinB superfamily